ncbi:hypothetical protein STEG23_005056 [Scotinomys teguina]
MPDRLLTGKHRQRACTHIYRICVLGTIIIKGEEKKQASQVVPRPPFGYHYAQLLCWIPPFLADPAPSPTDSALDPPPGNPAAPRCTGRGCSFPSALGEHTGSVLIHNFVDMWRKRNLKSWTLAEFRLSDTENTGIEGSCFSLSLSIPILDCHHTWCCCGIPSDFYCATQTWKTYCFDAFPSIDKISNVTSPVLVSHGTEDEVIDFSHALAMYEHCPGT